MTNARKGRSAQSADDAQNIDKVREILFGSQARAVDKKLSTLDKTLRKQTDALAKDLQNRMDDLEDYVQGEIKALQDRLKLEQNERTADVREASRTLTEAQKGLQKRLTDQLGAVQAGNKGVVKRVEDQGKRLQAEIQQTYDELLESQNEAFDELLSDKQDRQALADLFRDLAAKLGGKKK
ncbi:MAG: hypothetical protein OER86_03005 [Phycisphaerae bacterium]|nr:hypothetical protein [Phycisphaerae bacterium]